MPRKTAVEEKSETLRERCVQKWVETGDVRWLHKDLFMDPKEQTAEDVEIKDTYRA